ncbi:hypothetical protein KNU62_gp87 [Gordonia phage Bakery]|uniref:Uncharacterized protein n=1 Tax=Gordonia phage Bakery TaxID=2591205 RepID=A0A514DGY1_9CAUD|nr:hypothetical protein KNU62_gp87 [Gordonia phage Bakery]QDH92871.1 hypothetical protein SEA_BAKERY_87 [Gordonia phage Bakery]
MAENNGIEPAATGEFIYYTTDDGKVEVQLRAVDGTVWLTQAQIADLYDTSVQNVQQIISRILADQEVSEATINSELIVRNEGGRLVRRPVKHYNLDMVLAIGYRVTTARAVQFRKWATTVLTEYLIKGFAMNDAKLKDPTGVDYFDELLARIRDIRASEKRFYQKVRDLFKETSSDYDSKSPAATTFYKTIQNKLVYAVTGRTAAELVCERSDPSKPNMGLTTWDGAQVRKNDVGTSKNYLTEDEVTELNRLTNMFLDYAEDRASRHEAMTMARWAEVTDKFLDFNDRSVLRNAGSVSAASMKEIVGARYDEFDKARKAAALERSEDEHVEELESLVRERRKQVGKR